MHLMRRRVERITGGKNNKVFHRKQTRGMFEDFHQPPCSPLNSSRVLRTPVETDTVIDKTLGRRQFRHPHPCARGSVFPSPPLFSFPNTERIQTSEGKLQLTKALPSCSTSESGLPHINIRMKRQPSSTIYFFLNRERS